LCRKRDAAQCRQTETAIHRLEEVLETFAAVMIPTP
jgi:hypothetical protein